MKTPWVVLIALLFTHPGHVPRCVVRTPYLGQSPGDYREMAPKADFKSADYKLERGSEVYSMPACVNQFKRRV